jgi:hypothetical protein
MRFLPAQHPAKSKKMAWSVCILLQRQHPSEWLQVSNNYVWIFTATSTCIRLITSHNVLRWFQVITWHTKTNRPCSLPSFQLYCSPG